MRAGIWKGKKKRKRGEGEGGCKIWYEKGGKYILKKEGREEGRGRV